MTEKSRLCHMHASSHNSVHLSSWPKSHWATSPLGHFQGNRKNWASEAVDSFQMDYRWYLPCSEAYCEEVRACSHSAERNYTDVSLIIVKPNLLACQLIMAVKAKKRKTWPLIIKKEFAWIMSFDFLAIYWTFFLWMEISDCEINGSHFQTRGISAWSST